MVALGPAGGNPQPAVQYLIDQLNLGLNNHTSSLGMITIKIAGGFLGSNIEEYGTPVQFRWEEIPNP